MANFLPPNYIAAAVFFILCSIARYVSVRKQRVHVPAVGADGVLKSYRTAYRYLFDPKTVLQEGYDKYKSSTFQIPHLHGWIVVISGNQLIEELRSAPDDSFNFLMAVDKRLCLDYTIGRQVHRNTYHAPIVRTTLTRSIGSLFEDIRDEVLTSCEDLISLDGDKWTPIPALYTMQRVVCRTTNRVFVGLPLCRIEDYVELQVGYTKDIIKCGEIISQFPTFMKPLVAKMLGLKARSLKRALKHLGPIIDERLRLFEKYGKERADKPTDMLQWLIEEAEGIERTREYLALRMLFINFAAIHTTSNTFTQALFHLASKPHHIAPMREEVEAIVKKEGWTKSAVTKMHKVDSFLKEAARFNGINVISVERLALKDFTFSDGTFIPKDTLVCAAARATHFDRAHYKDPEVFDGFRFANMREQQGEGVKNQMVATSPEFLTFGHGRHACPGRFFAVNEIKTILAHLVVTYDIKMETEGVRPTDKYYFAAVVPDQDARVMMRRRQE